MSHLNDFQTTQKTSLTQVTDVLQPPECSPELGNTLGL